MKRLITLFLLPCWIFSLCLVPDIQLEASHSFNRKPVPTFPNRRPRQKIRIVRASHRYVPPKTTKVPVKNPQLRPPTQAQVQEILEQQKNGSPMELGTTGITGTPPTSNIEQVKAQMQALIAQAWAIYYEWLAYFNAYNAQWGAANTAAYNALSNYYSSYNTGCFCYSCTACYNTYVTKSNEANALTTAEIAYTQQQTNRLLALVPQIQSLIASIQINPGSQPTAMLSIPPSFNMNMLAQKFDFDFPPSLGDDSVLDDPQGSEAIGELADMAGEDDGAALPGPDEKKLKDYDRAQYGAQAYASQLDKLAQMGELAAKKADKGDKRAGYALEYYQLNYNELGPKYKELADQQARQADNLAQEALSGKVSAPAAPKPSAAQVPAQDLEADANAQENNYLDKAKESIIEKGMEKLQEKAEEVASNLFGKNKVEQIKAIFETEKKALEGLNLIGKVAAVLGDPNATDEDYAEVQASLNAQDQSMRDQAEENYKVAAGLNN